MPQGTPYIDTATGDLKYQGTSGTPAILAEADGTVHLIPIVFPYTGSTGFQSVGTTTFTSIGTIVFDPSALYDGNSNIDRTFKFQAIVEVTSGVTVEVRLYNIDTGVAVTNSTQTSTSTVPEVLSATLTVGASPNLVNAEQIYDVQIRISLPISPSPSDRAICKSAQIIASWGESGV